MSAAAPPPSPPHIAPVATTNGYSVEGGHAATNNGFGGPSPRKPFPHLQDLVNRASERINVESPIHRLLEQAGLLLKQAKTSLDFRHPDQAYADYLAAYMLVVYTIPKQHRDSLMLQDRLQLGVEHKRLLKEVTMLEPTYNSIKQTIVDDNGRSGVLPTIVTSQGRRLSQAASMAPVPKANGSVSFSLNASQRSPARLVDSRTDRESIVRDNSPTNGKPKPTVQPKPHNLHGAVVASVTQRSSAPSNGPQTDALSARFAQLRTDGNSVSSRVNQLATNDDAQLPTSGNPLDYFQPKTNLNSISSATNGFPKVPIGMNSIPRVSRISINPSLNKELPQPPSPAYSPARSLQDASPLNPVRNTRNSVGGHRGSISSTTSLTYESIGKNYMNGINGTIPSGVANAQRPGGQTRRKSINMPLETEITAARLYDYLSIYKVLLVDVRSREDYDSGHIPYENSICVEPAALRPNMSAEQLQDALVVSEDAEETLFNDRDKFDLVVYYDQSSASPDFLSNRPPSRCNMSLRYLHDALHEYNTEKPLYYPPVLMKGGINAWIELRGEQALISSNNPTRATAGKPGRPIARRPLVTSSGSRLLVQKRRPREYNPLGPEEEEKWRERARSETVVLNSQPQVETSMEEEEGEEPGPETPYARDIGDFFQRFPDLATIERQSMTTPTSRAPNYPAPPAPRYQPPALPSHSPPSVPTVPARPPPIMQRPSYSGVSDRSASQNMPITKTSQLAPYISPKLKKIPRTGLYNFGATCYMNATIQCLSATIPLTAFFLDGAFIKYVQKENWKGSKGIMPELFTNLLRNLWQPNGVDTIRPTNFRKLCARLNKEWGSDRQQDANEFLGFLVDVLHEDLNTKWSRNPLKPLTTAQEAEREATPPFIASKTEWARYEHRDHSRLTDLFAGQHISRLQCTTCRHSSTTYEAFYSISVEIPQLNRPVTLDDCLRSYCASETLSGDEVWRCPHCQTSREATKKLLISRAPEFLVVHLKRFSASLGERARKIHTPVEFPLTGLNLDPYMLPPPTAAERDTMSKRYGDADDVPRALQRPARYDAYAVMRHIGASMGSGHYIGLVKDAAKGCWREFNDERIGDFRPEALQWERRLQNEQAYLVFYQRVD